MFPIGERCSLIILFIVTRISTDVSMIEVQKESFQSNDDEHFLACLVHKKRGKLSSIFQSLNMSNTHIHYQLHTYNQFTFAGSLRLHVFGTYEETRVNMERTYKLHTKQKACNLTHNTLAVR